MGSPERNAGNHILRERVRLISSPRRGEEKGSKVCGQLTPNFTSLIASKFCTPPPTRLVV